MHITGFLRLFLSCRAEQRKQEWEERQKERRAREEAEKGEPFEEEVSIRVVLHLLYPLGFMVCPLSPSLHRHQRFHFAREAHL